ncbi:MAG: hypothetical protein AAGI11_10220 [Pseudomonadota bacterium]
MQYQAMEISEHEAAKEAARSAKALMDMANQSHPCREDIAQFRYWQATARTFTCHTCLRVRDQAAARLPALANVFYDAASPKIQPWYPEFKGGECRPGHVPTAEGTLRQQRVVASFDLHVGRPRSYRQLLSLHAPEPHCRVLVARSISDPQEELPVTGKLAYTPSPNGEVFEWQEGDLYWHHICTTPGARVLPGPLDRWLINGLRRFGLDKAERTTYRREAEMLRDWIEAGGLEQDQT